MMRYFWAASVAFLLSAIPIGVARAQLLNARIVLQCGQQNYASALVGQYREATQDLTGTLCTVAGAGGGSGGGTGGSVTQGTSPWVDNITQWANTTLGAATAYGTAPSGNVPGVNSFITNFPSIQAISGTVTANQGAAGIAPWLTSIYQGGAALSPTNGLPTTDTNASQTISSSGTAPAKAQGVQSATGTALATAAGQTNTQSAPGTGAATPTGIQGGGAGALPVGVSGAVTANQPVGATLNTAQVSIAAGATPTLIAAASASFVHREYQNSGTAVVYIGTSGVTTATGYPVPAGAVYPFSQTSAALYGITAAASAQAGATMQY